MYSVSFGSAQCSASQFNALKQTAQRSKNEQKKTTTTKKIYFDRDLELFILELRKYTQKTTEQKENNNDEHHTRISRERNAFHLECNGKSHRKTK